MKFKLPWTVCRVCLREGQMFSLFLKDNAGMSIAEKLRIVADVKVLSDKKLPEEICRRCMILLNTAFEFQIKCKKSEFLLQMSVKYKEQLDHGEKQSAIILTLNNGKIYTMPKDVTVKTKSASLNSNTQTCTDKNAKKLQLNKIEANSIENDASEKNRKAITEYGATSVEALETASNMGSESEPESRDIDAATARVKTQGPNTEIKTNKNISSTCNTTTVQSKRGQEKNPKRRKSTTRERNKFGRLSAPNKPKIFVCELCGNRYKSKIGFDLHMRIHRNERPYKCELCSASFIQGSKLTTHMRRHTGERPYQCNYCSRRFLKKEAKLIHERMHTGEKPYECNICSKKFSYTSVLARHKFLHTNEEKNFECIPCGKRFRFKYHLVAHLKTFSHQNPLK